MSIGIERIEFWKEESNKNYLITKEHIEFAKNILEAIKEQNKLINILNK